jgi:hypothetical protein
LSATELALDQVRAEPLAWGERLMRCYAGYERRCVRRGWFPQKAARSLACPEQTLNFDPQCGIARASPLEEGGPAIRRKVQRLVEQPLDLSPPLR